METYKNNNWDEIVFEFKNKEYGAFLLRKKYTKSLITAIIIGIAITVLIIVPAFLTLTYDDTDAFIVDNSITANLINIKQHQEEIPPPPPPPPIEIKKKTKFNTPVVVDTVKEVVEITPSDQVIDSITNQEVKDVALTDSYVSIEEEPVDFLIIEEKPEFPGGETALMRYIASNIKYTEAIKESGISGKLLIFFVINQEGKVTNVELLKSIDPYLDKEALRAVTDMPEWKPGKQKGKPVRVSFKLPIYFKL
jgi:periplasmic protein TonB